MIDNISKLSGEELRKILAKKFFNDSEAALKDLDIDIKNEDKEIKSMYEILSELAEKWENLKDE